MKNLAFAFVATSVLAGCSSNPENFLANEPLTYSDLQEKQNKPEVNKLNQQEKTQSQNKSESKPSPQKKQSQRVQPPKTTKANELKPKAEKQPKPESTPVPPQIPSLTLPELLKIPLKQMAPPSLGHPLQDAEELYFMLGEDEVGPYLYAEGSVVKGAYNKFLKYVKHFEGRGINLNRFMMHSPGGLLNEGLKIGQYIRDNNWITDADKNIKCYSSCGFIYASGVAQYMQRGAEVGFHRPYYPSKADTPESTRQFYQDYLPYWEYIQGNMPLYDKFMLEYGRSEMYILNEKNINQYFYAELY